jgi:hypothetical protein
MDPYCAASVCCRKTKFKWKTAGFLAKLNKNGKYWIDKTE